MVNHLGIASSISCSGNTEGYQSLETWARMGLTASLAFSRLPVGVFGGPVRTASCCCCSCGRMVGTGVGLWGDGVLGFRLEVLEIEPRFTTIKGALPLGDYGPVA